MIFFSSRIGIKVILIILIGALAGLIAITPAAGFVPISGAFVIGIVGGVGVSRGVLIKEIFGFDDALDAFGVHAIGGLIGSIFVGLFAKQEVGGVNGAFYGYPKQLGLQIYAIVVTACWASFATWCIMHFVDFFIGLRVSQVKEGVGLDRSLHGSTMYSQITNVPQRKKDAEENRKMTVIRRLRERSAANEAALDIVEERVIRQPKESKNRDVEMIGDNKKDSNNINDKSQTNENIHENNDFVEQNGFNIDHIKHNQKSQNNGDGETNGIHHSDSSTIEIEVEFSQGNSPKQHEGFLDPEKGYAIIPDQKVNETI